VASRPGRDFCLKSLRELYQQNQRWVPILFFLLGFVFDTLMLRRIDEPKVILQQAIYLIVSAALIGAELVGSTREVAAPRGLSRVWKYREALLHFLMGTLLNCYTIFYFKSASALTSFGFIGALVALLVLNEFKRFGKSQTQVHMALLSLCLLSYTVALSPILWGSIGTLPFLCAILASLLIFWLYYRLLTPRLAAQPSLLRTHVAYPFAAIASLFVALYFAGAIPPVPLSVTFMGIYHDVQKSEGGFRLTYTRGPFRFWQHGDQTFLARPGDSIFCFVQVFSPSRFKDQLQVRWLYHDERSGWQPQDAIPMPIVGGREEGYRGVTKKNNYQPGLWRVQIETRDNQEIGWISFRVERDDSTDERPLTTVVR
jgi:hypothetical protein